MQPKEIEFGEYLRQCRKNKKLTVRQLDLYSGVSHSYISQLERGKRGIPSPEVLKKLSKPLDVEYNKLMEKAGHLEEVKLLKEIMDEYVGVNIDLLDEESIEKMPIYIGDLELTTEMKRKLVDMAKLFFETNDIPPKKK